MNSILYNMPRQGLNWLLPKRCIRCIKAIDGDQGSVCDTCYLKLPFQDNYCKQCGQNFSSNIDYCGRCINTPPTFDLCFCPFKYESDIKELICDLKYRERPELAKSTAFLLEKELREQRVELPDALISVPMHITRLRERGYNHSALLAHHLGKALRIHTLKGALAKSRETKPQAQQSLKQRKKNLLGSFSLKTEIRAKRVAIVDDVLTTGATAEEIAKILKKNGVDCVQLWAIAHTL